MIIQIGHARNSSFQEELYEPIRKASFFSEHTFIFPHDGVEVNSIESLKIIDLFLADVSIPSTGLGIELGLASAYEKKILCLSKKGSKISSSVSRISDNFIEYENTKELVEKIGNFLRR